MYITSIGLRKNFYVFSVIQCARPSIYSETTYIEEADESFPFGTEIEFKCLPGYQLFTSTVTINCTDAGDWYPHPPVCSG